jgi:hypothetical protein
MTLRKSVWFFGLLLVGIFICHSQGQGQSKSETKAPIITYSYGIDKGRYGHIWKIYIEAEDPDGDMFEIASVVEQVGYGLYPTNWTILKPQNRRHLKGYIQWNTFSSHQPFLTEPTYITLKVSILDRSRNESNVVVFPFEFTTGTGTEPKTPSPFDQGDVPKLGNIYVNLFDPSVMGGAGPGPVK